MKNKKSIYFVCCAIQNNQLLNQEFSTTSSKKAAEMFYSFYQIKPEIINGPFFKKRQVKKKNNSIKFNSVTYDAVFKTFKVKAFELTEPKDHAYLIFISHQNESCTDPLPKEITIVSITELNKENIKI